MYPEARRRPGKPVPVIKPAFWVLWGSVLQAQRLLASRKPQVERSQYLKLFSPGSPIPLDEGIYLRSYWGSLYHLRYIPIKGYWAPWVPTFGECSPRHRGERGPKQGGHDPELSHGRVRA